MLLCMCLLFESFVATRCLAFERTCFAVDHRDMTRQTILKCELPWAFGAFERARLLVQCADVFVSGMDERNVCMC